MRGRRGADCGFLADFRGFLTRYGGAPAGFHGQRPVTGTAHFFKFPASYARGAGDDIRRPVTAASASRPVTGGASGAVNFSEKLAHGQRPAGRGRFYAVTGGQAAA